MKSLFRNLFAVILVFCSGSYIFSQDIGTTAGEFLIFPPAAREDAMAGIAEGFNSQLESMPYNPALITPIDDFQLSFSIYPYLNLGDISLSQVSTVFPAGIGNVGLQLQFFQQGLFTGFDPEGQIEEEGQTFDLTLGATYAVEFADFFSVGISGKAWYQNLSDSYGFSAMTDIGTMFRFELPYIGMPPTAPTYEESQARYDKDKISVDKANEDRLKIIAADFVKAETERDKVQLMFDRQNEKITAEEAKVREGDDRAKLDSLLEKKAEYETQLAEANTAVEQASADTADARAKNDIKYQEELSVILADKERRDNNILYIDEERERLFAVVNDPEKGLSAELIEENITGILDNLNKFHDSQTESINTAGESFITKREELISNAEDQISKYQSNIEEATGPPAAALRNEISSIEQQIASLEGKEDEDSKNQLKLLKKDLAVKNTGLKSLESDPWVKRLNSRIAEKEKEIAEYEAEISKKQEETAKTLENLQSSLEKYLEKIEKDKNKLLDDLKLAQLTREIEILQAASDKGKEKSKSDYREKELDIYARLLSQMYGMESRIIQSRLDSVRENASVKLYDLKIETKKTREQLDDDYEFNKRLQEQKIKDIKGKIDRNNPDASVQAQLDEAIEELTQLNSDYKAAIDSLTDQEKISNSDIETEKEREIARVINDSDTLRLIYLQSEKEFKNGSVALSVRNLGIPMTLLSQYETESWELPLSFYLSLGYAFMNIEGHTLSLSGMVDYFLSEMPHFGVGLEYSFSEFIYARVGYMLTLPGGSTGRNISAGLGLNMKLGMADYAIDYAFIPKEIGFTHNFGITIKF